jgi:hypothetical protein
MGGMDIVSLVKGLVILGAASFFLSMVSEQSRSWMIVAAFHALGNIGFMGNSLDVPGSQRLLMAGIAMAIMIFIYSRFNHREFMPSQLREQI